jgi:hypothetical protein
MGIMLIGHGSCGWPFICTSTGIGLRQPDWSIDVRFALTNT